MGKIVVLLHGTPSDRRVWDTLVALTPSGTRCEAWDLLDHGASTAPEATADDLAADVVRRVRALGDPVRLVGHSFGAWIAARAAVSLGGMVESCVALNGLSRAPDALADELGGLADAFEASAIDLPTGVSIAAQRWLPAASPRPEHVEHVRRIIADESPVRLVRQIRRLCSLRHPSARLTSLSVPMTIVASRDDRAVPAEAADELAALASDVTRVILDGDSHFTQWTHTTRVAELVFGS